MARARALAPRPRVPPSRLGFRPDSYQNDPDSDQNDEEPTHPRPTLHCSWTLARASRLLYGHEAAVMKYAARGVRREEWLGTEVELHELASLPELVSTSLTK